MNTFDEIIQTKAYGDLSSRELEVISELVSSEEEYNAMKSFYTEIDQLAISNREDVSPSVKSSLNSVFQSKHPGISQNWNAPAESAEKKIVPLYNRNMFRAAALLVLSAGVIAVWVSMSENQLAKSNREPITASNDSVTKEETKKKFPLDEEHKKDYSAASTIPAEKEAEQRLRLNSNATSTAFSRTEDGMLPDQERTLQSAGDDVYKSASTLYSAPPVTSEKTHSNDMEKEAETGNMDAFTKAGLNADLNPGGFYSGRESKKDYKPEIKTSDLLSLIEPSF